MSDPPALEETEAAEAPPGVELEGPSRPDGPRPGGIRVGAIDAERLRSAVASRLFGVDAEPVKIGRFTVLKRLGAGGMGVVYSAYDDQLDRKLAIKLLRGEASEQRRARLLREAQSLARVSHPNVISVYEVGTFRQQVFVAMEFVRGGTLGEVCSAAGVGVLEILAWYAQAGRGLAAAHAAGLVHRDFKPENCLVGDDGRVRVLDFGLARAAGEGGELREEFDEEERRQLSGTHDTRASGDSLADPLTRTGAIMGTPAYMAPEQHLGVQVDARTDQFAFCVSLWESLYKERPFAGNSMAQLALNVTGGQVREPPAGRGVPKWVHRALLRGLAVHPEERWPDMEALLAALSPERRRRRRRVFAVGGLLLAAGLGTAYASLRAGPGPCEAVQAELEGVWDASVRARLASAFEDSEAPFAEDAFRSSAAALDDYAEAWLGARRRACVAARVDQSESPELYGRKMVCLGRRLAELEAFTQEMAQPDEAAIKRSVQAVAALGSVAACEDGTAAPGWRCRGMKRRARRSTHSSARWREVRPRCSSAATRRPSRSRSRPLSGRGASRARGSRRARSCCSVRCRGTYASSTRPKTPCARPFVAPTSRGTTTRAWKRGIGSCTGSATRSETLPRRRSSRPTPAPRSSAWGRHPCSRPTSSTASVRSPRPGTTSKRRSNTTGGRWRSARGSSANIRWLQPSRATTSATRCYTTATTPRRSRSCVRLCPASRSCRGPRIPTSPLP